MAYPPVRSSYSPPLPAATSAANSSASAVSSSVVNVWDANLFLALGETWPSRPAIDAIYEIPIRRFLEER